MNKNKILIAYFSCQNHTKQVAENLSKVTKGDLYEIKPLIPYTKEDLKWTDENARTTIECKDENSRPQIIIDENLNIENYNIIFLGFPIWWYTAPPIIKTFLESYDFNNKIIVVFATSGGSGMGKSIEKLKDSAKNAIFKEGGLVNSDLVLKKIAEMK